VLCSTFTSIGRYTTVYVTNCLTGMQLIQATGVHSRRHMFAPKQQIVLLKNLKELKILNVVVDCHVSRVQNMIHLGF